ncbi:hypothetical protein ACFL2V_03865 [Pseudomonadota bacterium]
MAEPAALALLGLSLLGVLGARSANIMQL